MQTIGRFALLDALGQLGRAASYEAYDPNLDRRVELQVLAAADAEAAELESFSDRAAQWSGLDHPGVARVHEIGTGVSGVFVAVEAGRQTVEQWCEGGDASFERLVAMFDDALAGLAAAHESGLVHGAVDGRSLIVSREGRAKLSRFVLLAGEGSAEASPSRDAVALCGAFARYGASVRAPRWFSGLTEDGQREADLDVLRGRLAREARRRSRWVSQALVAGVALATAAIAWRDAARRETPPADSCPDGQTLLTEAWGPQRKADIEAAIMATGRQQRAWKWQELEGRFDRWTEAWKRSRLEACEASTASDAEAATQQATIACLDDRRMQLEIVSEAFAEVDNDSFARMIADARVLPRPEDCLQRDDGEAREASSKAVQEVSHEMAKAYALQLVQRVEEAEAIYLEMAPRAESIGFYALASEAYRYLAVVAGDRGDAARAYAMMRRSLTTAEQGRQSVMIVRAWHRLADNAWYQGDVERAEFFIARALARSEGEAMGDEVRMELLTFEAQRLSSRSRPAEAAQRYIEAYEVIQRNEMEPLLALQALFQASQATSEAGDREGAEALAERVAREGSERYGPHHWIVALAQAELAQSALRAKDHATGLRWSTEAIDVEGEPGHPMYAQTKAFATLMHAELLRAHGRTEEGRALLAAMLEELEPHLGANSQVLVTARSARALFATELGRPCEAADVAGPVVAQIEATGTFSPQQLATEFLNLADAQSLCGRMEQGLANLERGLALTEKLPAASARYRFEQERRSGMIFKQLGEPARAEQAFERALSLAEPIDVDLARLEWIRDELASLAEGAHP